jgi:hypothetical protein
MDRPEVIGGPADQRKDRARTEGQHTGTAGHDTLGGVPAKADPVLEAALDPDQFDLGQGFARAGRDRR